MEQLIADVERIAADTSFSGVVRVDVDGETVIAKAYGLADRAHGVANTVETRFGIASGVKGLTASTVLSLATQGVLALTTTARSLLGDDLPLIDDDVTVAHLLAHRSGIGDFFDEEIERPITDYVLAVPVHELATTEDYLKVLDGYPAKFPAGERFAYCNGGYVVLALLAERAAGTPFDDLVRRHVCEPAGMTGTEFLRSDELPGDAAIGYLANDGPRSNVFHLPVRGSGDGGIYSTAADIARFWAALFAGAIVPTDVVTEVVRPHSDVPDESARYGLGFWLHPSNDSVRLVGYDAGVSFYSAHRPSTGVTHTVLSNTSDGVWPLSRRLREVFDT